MTCASRNLIIQSLSHHSLYLTPPPLSYLRVLISPLSSYSTPRSLYHTPQPVSHLSAPLTPEPHLTLQPLSHPSAPIAPFRLYLTSQLISDPVPRSHPSNPIPPLAPISPTSPYPTHQPLSYTWATIPPWSRDYHPQPQSQPLSYPVLLSPLTSYSPSAPSHSSVHILSWNPIPSWDPPDLSPYLNRSSYLTMRLLSHTLSPLTPQPLSPLSPYHPSAPITPQTLSHPWAPIPPLGRTHPTVHINPRPLSYPQLLSHPTASIYLTTPHSTAPISSYGPISYS